MFLNVDRCVRWGLFPQKRFSLALFFFFLSITFYQPCYICELLYFCLLVLRFYNLLLQLSSINGGTSKLTVDGIGYLQKIVQLLIQIAQMNELLTANLATKSFSS